MSDMEVGGLSLDDIIKKDGIKGGKFGGRKRRDGGVQKPKRDPKKWDNDKFFQGQQGSRRNSAGGGGRAALSGKSMARLSNIPFTISQEDLDDLFAEYRLSKIVLHYDVRGRSLGTAELHGQSVVISKLARDFKGVEIDGRPLALQVVGAGSSSLSSGSPRIRRVGGGGNRSERSGRRSGGSKSGDDSRKKKLTADELDRELEEYMKSSGKA